MVKNGVLYLLKRSSWFFEHCSWFIAGSRWSACSNQVDLDNQLMALIKQIGTDRNNLKPSIFLKAFVQHILNTIFVMLY